MDKEIIIPTKLADAVADYLNRVVDTHGAETAAEAFYLCSMLQVRGAAINTHRVERVAPTTRAIVPVKG